MCQHQANFENNNKDEQVMGKKLPTIVGNFL
jgi:hypothetical protein